MAFLYAANWPERLRQGNVIPDTHLNACGRSPVSTRRVRLLKGLDSVHLHQRLVDSVVLVATFSG